MTEPDYGRHLWFAFTFLMKPSPLPLRCWPSPGFFTPIFFFFPGFPPFAHMAPRPGPFWGASKVGEPSFLLRAGFFSLFNGNSTYGQDTSWFPSGFYPPIVIPSVCGGWPFIPVPRPPGPRPILLSFVRNGAGPFKLSFF